MSALKKRGLQQYGSVAVSSEADFATPHRLVQMLMEGALDKMSAAKGYMLRNEIAAKGEHLSWAISIIGGLREALDFKNGGEIASNLDDLYEYMSRRLVEANVTNDTAILDEVSSLMLEIKRSWDVMPETVVQTAGNREAVSAE